MIVAAMGIVALLSAEAAEAVLDRMCEGVPRYWQVAFTNEVRVPWSACPSATSATLKAIGMDGESTTTITRSGEELETAHFLTAPNGEDVYTLELNYATETRFSSIFQLQRTTPRKKKGAEFFFFFFFE